MLQLATVLANLYDNLLGNDLIIVFEFCCCSKIILTCVPKFLNEISLVYRTCLRLLLTFIWVVFFFELLTFYWGYKIGFVTKRGYYSALVFSFKPFYPSLGFWINVLCSFSFQAGYVGEDVESILYKLLMVRLDYYS